MAICDKCKRDVICRYCGRDKIIATERFFGWPGYYVEATRKVYCGYCDIPPVMTLDTETLRGYRLVLDNDHANA